MNPNDEEKLGTPLPGETVALFYARSRMQCHLIQLHLLYMSIPQDHIGPRRRPKKLAGRPKKNCAESVSSLRRKDTVGHSIVPVWKILIYGGS